MKMKVFSCVLLAVLVVGGLALADTTTGGFTINCVHTITVTGNLDFNTGSNARVAGYSGHVLCDGYISATLSVNCDCNIAYTADGKFVGTGTNPDSMDATWYLSSSTDGSNWFSAAGPLVNPWNYSQWDKSTPGTDEIGTLGITYDNTWDGVGYARWKVGVDRTGFGDRADTYYATLTYSIY